MVQNIEIIFENEDFLVINKPAGLLVHAAPNTKEKTLVDWLLENYPEIKNVGDDPQLRPGIVHRLDKETSGALLVAKNQATFQELKALFQARQIEKTYLALVQGKMPQQQGSISLPLAKAKKSTKRTVRARPEQKTAEAITDWSVEKEYPATKPTEQIFSLLRVKPRTGRTHQIRVHLAAVGHPVVADYLYGGKTARGYRQELNRVFLHASSLKFKFRQTNYVFEVELPEELANFLKNLSA